MEKIAAFAHYKLGIGFPHTGKTGSHMSNLKDLILFTQTNECDVEEKALQTAQFSLVFSSVFSFEVFCL